MQAREVERFQRGMAKLDALIAEATNMSQDTAKNAMLVKLVNGMQVRARAHMVLTIALPRSP